MGSRSPRTSDHVRYVRYLPNMRSAYIERFRGGPEAVTFFTAHEYLDPDLLDERSYRQVERKTFLRTAWRARFDVIAVPEPFWIAELIFTTLVSALAVCGGAVRGTRVRVVTYAIENADSTMLAGLPRRVPVQIRRFVLALATLPMMLMLSRIAFGTADARRNYLTALWPAIRRRVDRRSAVFLPLSPACECREPVAQGDTVLFLGPLEGRKGFDDLLDAWAIVEERDPAARLVVCGNGRLQPRLDEELTRHPSIRQVKDASRPEMHELLGSATVLVSLPRVERRWREQIGLSVPEGISHGCHIVTTRQTGISDWLDAHGQTVLEPGSSPRVIADALIDALRDPRAVPPEDLPEISGRADAEWWMTGQHEHASSREGASVHE